MPLIFLHPQTLKLKLFELMYSANELNAAGQLR